jgi:hypothetical protein
MRPAGGNHSLLRKYVDEIWRIQTDHFDAGGASIRNLHKAPVPLEQVLVRDSSYSRSNLKPPFSPRVSRNVAASSADRTKIGADGQCR